MALARTDALARWGLPAGAVAVARIETRLSRRDERVNRAVLPSHKPERAAGEPGGTRTRDPVLKRHMLYHLSYRPISW